MAKSEAKPETGKVVVIGGSHGIGLFTVQAFLAKGCDVVATCRNPDDGANREALDVLGECFPGRLTVKGLDLSKPESIHAFASDLKEEVSKGGERYRGIVYNGAIGGIRGIEEKPGVTRGEIDDNFKNVMQTNFRGPELLAAELHSGANRGAIADPRGMVVSYVVSSVVKEEYGALAHSHWALNHLKILPYTTSKVAVCDELIRPQAGEAFDHRNDGPPVSVHGVSPGGKDGTAYNAASFTRMIGYNPFARDMKPSQSAGGIVKLVTDEWQPGAFGLNNGNIVGWTGERSLRTEPQEDFTFASAAARIANERQGGKDIAR